MCSVQDFQPNWASAPGETIADILKERGLSVTVFAERMGQPLKDIDDLLQGRATITLATARRLEHVLGGSVEFWMSRDFQYREDVSRFRAVDEDWLRQLPLGDMIKLGWLTPVPRPTEEASACLRFFDVPNVQAWRHKYAGLEARVAFRTSPSFDSRPAAVAAWLRQGEIEAAKIDCAPWDASRFHQRLVNIRSLTRVKDPNLFLPQLRQRCAESGVAVAVVRSPTGCRASGATLFLSEDKALLLLSFRYLSDDHFWFTFFHEAGHLLLHGKESLFVEGDDRPQVKEEQEANNFAAETLIPHAFQNSLLEVRANARDIIRFARRVGVSPGVVVGQLQHLGKLGPNRLNRLKRRFQWG